MATKQKSKTNKTLIVVLLVMIVSILLLNRFYTTEEIITTKKFQTLISKHNIDKISIDDYYIHIKTPDKKYYKIYKNAIDQQELYNNFKIEVVEDYSYIYDIFSLVLLIFFILYIIKALNKNRSTQQIQMHFAQQDNGVSEDSVEPISSNVTFDDVAGIDMVKDELEEIIDFLKRPERYVQMGIRMPKGVLLVGPPGVGKTLVAKAVAGEADVPFFYQSGASFVQIYVGMGAKRVSKLFEKAKQQAPSIIFIDEIDAVGKSRDLMGNDERESTLNELLTQMDGFAQNSGVIVIAATNKIEVLDDALLRAGRFDRRIHLSLPNIQERAKIIALYLDNKPHKVDIEYIAKMSVGFSAAALDTLVNEATLNALRDSRYFVENRDFEAVKEKVISGKKLIQSYSKEEKEIQALYQASKAVIASWLGVEFERVSIVSTMFDEFDHEISSKTSLINKAKVYLSGAIALQQEYNEYFTNAKDDIKMAKNIIHQVLDEYAMSHNFSSSSREFEELFEQNIKEVEGIVSRMKVAIKKVSAYLQEYENITQKECMDIIDEIF